MRDLPDSGPCVARPVREAFGIDSEKTAPAFPERTEHVPAVDPAYRFDPETTMAILAGFSHNRRVLLQGYHGTGKSSHIEQVAARLNWPCLRINLDSQISRMDLVGKDAIAVSEGRQITEFRPGMFSWAIERPVALVFDEYDAGRPDTMFVIQRVLEVEGRLTLVDQNRVLHPHPFFRLFATANTVGLGDSAGIYHGTQPLNQGQLDRWHIVATLNYLPPEREVEIVVARVPAYEDAGRAGEVRAMVALASLTREGFGRGELSTVMSPRTVIGWAENCLIFGDLELAFRLSFLNRCDDAEKPLVTEYFQRCFDRDLKPLSG